VVPRWVQLVLLPLAVLGVYGLARAAGPVLLLFIVAGVVALILNPFVHTLRRRARLPRGLAVLVVCLGLLLAAGAVGLALAEPVADQFSALQDAVPEAVDDADAALADVQEWLSESGIGIQVRRPGEDALETLGDSLLQGSGDVVAFTEDLLTTVVEASLALILVVVLSVYMLLYGERIGALVRRVVPPGDGTAADDYPTRVQRAVGGYVRGQLAFSVIMGASAGLMLWIQGSLGLFEDGARYALFFGLFFGFAELIPYVGPAIGAAPPMLVALFQQPLDAVWLGLMFTALQQLEGHIVAPQVFARSLQLNPLLVIFALLLGGQIYGFVGAFIALPLAAVVRETVVYLSRHLALEPWPAAAPLLAGHDPPAARPCPECATPLATHSERTRRRPTGGAVAGTGE